MGSAIKRPPFIAKAVREREREREQGMVGKGRYREGKIKS
jgi:hypothetical protein